MRPQWGLADQSSAVHTSTSHHVRARLLRDSWSPLAAVPGVRFWKRVRASGCNRAAGLMTCSVTVLVRGMSSAFRNPGRDCTTVTFQKTHVTAIVGSGPWLHLWTYTEDVRLGAVNQTSCRWDMSLNVARWRDCAVQHNGGDGTSLRLRVQWSWEAEFEITGVQWW